ncbi:BatD family protein [Photobacterium japonica]|uniref:BatD family protein n=1 Tax=Photobacterium japonica TaxID=2910235 RepID=UPI003D118C80
MTRLNALSSSTATLSRWRHSMVALIACALFFFSAASQAAQAVATVSKNIVGVNEVFQLQVSIDDNVSTNALDLSPLSNDFNVGSPQVSSGQNIINGVISRSTSWRVAIAAKAVGEFVIPSFQIGATSTDPITITVMKSANAEAATDTKPNIALSATLEKDTAYVGETLRYSVRLRIGEQMSQASLQPPSGDGLDVKQQGDDSQFETVINGRRYLVITRDYQITPTKDGEILLRGAGFTGSIVKGNRGFGSTLRLPFEEHADDLTLNIKGKPASYKGLWLPTEDLQLAQKWDPESPQIKVGEPITRTLTLRIKNAEQSTLPNITLTYPSAVRVYDEKPVYGSEGDYTTMTLKQVIIPRAEGQLALPSLAINWWDTTTDKPQTSKVDGLTLDVQPGDSHSSLMVAPPANGNTTIDLAEKNTPQPTAITPQEEPSSGIWPWVCGVLALLWAIFTGLWWHERTQRQALTRALAQYATPTLRTLPDTDPLQGMINAVADNQTILLQTYFQQWIKQNPSHPSRESLHLLIEKQMKARYSMSGDTANKEDITALQQQLQSLKKRDPAINIKQKSALEPLIP